MGQYKHDFNQIKNDADIERILRHYGIRDSLKSRGDERVGRCMLGKKGHGKKDSFAFNVEKKTFQCFSCKKRGSVIDFVRFHEGLTLPESAEKIVQIMDEPENQAEKEPVTTMAPFIEKRRKEQLAVMADQQGSGYGKNQAQSHDAILKKARQIMRERVNTQPVIDHPTEAGNLFVHDLGSEEREVFAVLFLDNKLRMIAYERMFFGTINGTHVYLREVLKKALLLNAQSIICGHNHPTAARDPSENDLHITRKLKEALELLEMELHDHIIVVGGEYVSMANGGHM
ncbi:MAG: DNA repair protein RadC [Gammaproteobacteria bacterium]|nr:DNA repair protein RadC [Gammaproteobacteria bacterium]